METLDKIVELTEQLRLANMEAEYNADWFDNLVYDLAKLLNCEAKASAVVAAVEAMTGKKSE